MPSPEEIVARLTETANNFALIAILWHLLFFILILFILTGWRPYRRLMGIFIILPLFSVGIFSLLSSNPFNTIVFFVLGIILLLFALYLPYEKVDFKWNFYSVFGILMITFGWIYPHFLNNTKFFFYLIASPLGLVPCPTLSLAIGFTLLCQGFYSRKWLLTMALAGLFYGLFGIFRLNVYLDAGLLAGAIVTGFLFFTLKKDRTHSIADQP
jgi:hypothetical protein